MSGQKIKPYPGTQSILRAIAILKCFDDNHQAWNLSALAQALDLNKTTVFRLLSALQSEGLVARSGDGEAYVLGPEIVTMGGFALRGIDLRTTARPTLERLATSTGETASLEIIAGDDMLIIDEVVGEYLVSGVRSLGTRWPMHGTSTGLAILAAWPEEKRESYLCRELKSIAPCTVTDPRVLRVLLQQFSSQGYAVSDEMLETGLVAIGAPVVNHDLRVEAAISIYGPKGRLSDYRTHAIGKMIHEAALDISSRLGYRAVGKTPQKSLKSA